MRSSLLFAGAVSLHLTAATNPANNSNCGTVEAPVVPYINASGSVSVFGPRPYPTYPATLWTWSRYVIDEIKNNQSIVFQTLGLHTLPLLNLSDPSIPFASYVIALNDFTSSTIHDDGTCSTVLGSGCLQNVINNINNTAAEFSSLGGADDGNTFLATMEKKLGDALSASPCQSGLYKGSFGAQFTPINRTGTPFAGCPTGNPGNSTPTVGPADFFSWADFEEAPNNFTAYDRAITSYVPIIVVSILKDRNTVDSQPNNWADTQVMCIPANETQPGSRNYTVALNAIGAAGRLQGGFPMLMIAALILTIMIIM